MLCRKHGSWLNVAEIELSVFTKQCLDRRIPDMATLQQEAKAWYCNRNVNQKAVDWQFTTEKARVKLKRLYPQIQMKRTDKKTLRPGGLEPPAFGLGNRCSILLSYGRFNL